MSDGTSELIKQREIGFFKFHPDPHQAKSAVELLRAMDEIGHAEVTGTHTLQISYDIRAITLEVIEALLVELGFHLETTLYYKLTRSLYYYTEETQRTNMGISQNGVTDTKTVFINRYQNILHGCRDIRPDQLKQYS
jgi:hypothetical protein